MSDVFYHLEDFDDLFHVVASLCAQHTRIVMSYECRCIDLSNLAERLCAVLEARGLTPNVSHRITTAIDPEAETEGAQTTATTPSSSPPSGTTMGSMGTRGKNPQRTEFGLVAILCV